MQNTSFLKELEAIVTSDSIITDANDQYPFVTEWRDRYQGLALAVVFPKTVQQVADIVKLCIAHNISIVPQGGNTGLVGGQIPDNTGRQIVMCLAKFNKVRSLDTVSGVMSVDSGVTLKQAQDYAKGQGFLLPLSIASQGSAQIGGVISTNAGGVSVLRYGMMRSLVLGIEAVLPSGEIWNGMRILYKDNMGYDLKQLFIGGEGTLGIVTGAVLKLAPLPNATVTAWSGFKDFKQLEACFVKLRHKLGEHLSSFELISDFAMQVYSKHKGKPNPLGTEYEWYGLIEATSTQSEVIFTNYVQEALGEILEEELAQDMMIAQNGQQATDFWTIRESLSEVQKHEGGSMKQDVSVPLAKIGDFIEKAVAVCGDVVPHCRPFIFGHVGDGNLHFNISQPADMDKAEFLSKTADMNKALYDLLYSYNGSVSAEHGIGQMKCEELKRYRPAVELHMMQAVKKALDPQNIMNPGRILG